MGTRPKPAPEGYEVVKVRGGFIVLVTPRDELGQLINFGFLRDTARQGANIPLVFRKRTEAISQAIFHQLSTEVAYWRAQSAGVDRSSQRLAGVS